MKYFFISNIRILAIIIAIIIALNLNLTHLYLNRPPEEEFSVYNGAVYNGYSVNQHNSFSGNIELLKSILVVISFYWNREKLNYLQTMILVASRYPTNVTIVIVTNNGAALENVKYFFGWPENVEIWEYIDKSGDAENKYSLLWGHRKLIESKIEAGFDYSSVIYMEDDTLLTWTAIISWARDTVVLEPLGFIRCFYRTEISKNGIPILNDYSFPLNLSTTHTIDLSNDIDLSNEKGGVEICTKTLNFDCVHRKYVAPVFTFQGMWIASKLQLERFMHHPYWIKKLALEAKIDLGDGILPGYPERTTCMNLFLDVKPGFSHMCMVPYVTSVEGKNSLSMAANVHHMRNGYGGLAFDNAITN